MISRLRMTKSTNGDDLPVRYAAMIALAVSLAFSSPLLAAADNEADAPETPVESTDDAASIVEGMIEEWLQGPGRALRTREDLNVVQGTSLVPFKADNQRWGKARSLTFQNAFVQAMGELHGVGPAADFRHSTAGLF